MDQGNDPELCDLPVAAAAVCLAVRRVGPRCGLQKSFQPVVVLAEYLASGMEVLASDPVLFDLPGVVSTGCPAAVMAVPESDLQTSVQPGAA